MLKISQMASVFWVWKIHGFVAFEKYYLLAYKDSLQQILTVDKLISGAEFLAYIALPGNEMTQKNTNNSFSIYLISQESMQN